MNKDMSRRQKFPRHTLGVVSAEFPKCCNRRRTREKAIKTKHQHRSQPTHVNLHALLRRSGESNYRAISPQTATVLSLLTFLPRRASWKTRALELWFQCKSFQVCAETFPLWWFLCYSLALRSARGNFFRSETRAFHSHRRHCNGFRWDLKLQLQSVRYKIVIRIHAFVSLLCHGGAVRSSQSTLWLLCCGTEFYRWKGRRK